MKKKRKDSTAFYEIKLVSFDLLNTNLIVGGHFWSTNRTGVSITSLFLCRTLEVNREYYSIQLVAVKGNPQTKSVGPEENGSHSFYICGRRTIF